MLFPLASTVHARVDMFISYRMYVHTACIMLHVCIGVYLSVIFSGTVYLNIVSSLDPNLIGCALSPKTTEHTAGLIFRSDLGLLGIRIDACLEVLGFGQGIRCLRTLAF